MRVYRSCFGIVLAILWTFLSAAVSVASDRLDHDITLRIIPDERRIEVTDQLTVSGRPTLTVHIADWMRVNDVLLNDTLLPIDRSQSTLRIPLPDRGSHRIELTAEGTILTPSPSGRPGSPPLAGSDGLYLPGRSGWYPTATGDTTAYRLTVTTPSAYRAAATGDLLSETLGEADNVAVFRSTVPMQTPAVFVGPYSVTERQFDGIRLRTYFHPEAAAFASGYLDAASAYLNLFTREIGAYPFADFHIVSAPIPVGLGFANLTYLDRRILPLPFMKGRSLAHEILHNWWGNGVYVTYQSGNWSEGLTTYMADHAVTERENPDAAREMRLGWLRDYAALPEDRDMPVNRFRSKSHDAAQVIGYGKAAFLFAMLEDEVGSDHFADAIRRFWTEHRFSHAAWTDIQAAFETTAGRELSWFFDQWLTRSGAPNLSLEEVAVAPMEDGYELGMTLTQSQPTYQLKVPLRVTTEAGEEHFDVRFDQSESEVRLELNRRPTSVRIDPDFRIFRRLHKEEAPSILRDVLLSGDAGALLLYDDPARRDMALQLVNRLIDGPGSRLHDRLPEEIDHPLVVAGPPEQIRPFIRNVGLPDETTPKEDGGTGRAWVSRLPGGTAVLLVETNDPATLRGMIRRLPHYRSKSFVLFDGASVSKHGIWDTEGGPLTIHLVAE